MNNKDSNCTHVVLIAADNSLIDHFIAMMIFQNILEDESKFTIDLKESDLIGLPDSVIATAKETAVERKKADG